VADHPMDPQADVPAQSPPQVRLRACDADRHATVQRLQDGIARGALSVDEGSERMAAAWASRYLDQLPPLIADLPGARPAQTAPAPGWSTLGALAAAQLRHTLRTQPTRDPRLNRLLAVIIGATALVVLGLITVAVVHGLLFDHPGFEGGNLRGGFGGGGFRDGYGFRDG
jgi:hypothetical protein